MTTKKYKNLTPYGGKNIFFLCSYPDLSEKMNRGKNRRIYVLKVLSWNKNLNWCFCLQKFVHVIIFLVVVRPLQQPLPISFLVWVSLFLRPGPCVAPRTCHHRQQPFSWPESKTWMLADKISKIARPLQWSLIFFMRKITAAIPKLAKRQFSHRNVS